MKYEKDEYEKLIDASPLFSLDREKEHAAYQREALKMVEHLYCYLLAVNLREYEPYGVEIVDVARRCIGNYAPSNGRFLNYFNVAWKNEYSHICGNEIIDNKFRGMKLSEQERRDVKKCMRLINKCNPNWTTLQKYEKVAELMEMSVVEIKTIIATSDTRVVGEYTKNAEGDEVGAFDLLSDDFLIESYFENLASLSDMLDKIEETFICLQERQKPIVADMMTIKIGDEIFEIDKLSKKYSFISEDISKLIKLTGIIPSQRDIAEKYGKNEASISRTMKEFINKLKGEKKDE